MFLAVLRFEGFVGADVLEERVVVAAFGITYKTALAAVLKAGL
jgi:hypothetical protein